MPYDVVIDEAARTIVITGTGTGSTADTVRLIAEQQQAFRNHPGFNLLYDSRQLQIGSSANDMVKVAEALFGQAGIVIGRIALVVPESRVTLARIFAALAHPHGVVADVFTQVADARAWLGIAE